MPHGSCATHGAHLCGSTWSSSARRSGNIDRQGRRSLTPRWISADQRRGDAGRRGEHVGVDKDLEPGGIGSADNEPGAILFRRKAGDEGFGERGGNERGSPALRTEDRCAYRRPGALPVNPARRNASAIASPLAGTESLGPARVSAGRRRLSDPTGATSARAMVGRASGA